MKKLILIISLFFTTSIFAGEVVKFDINKSLVDQLHPTKPTIIYIGENWCPYCQNAKRVLTKAAKKYDNIHIIFLETDLYPSDLRVNIGSDVIKEKLIKLKGIPKFVAHVPSKKFAFVGHADPTILLHQVIALDNPNE